MNAVSPLRYPGGKSAMAGLLTQIRRLNGLGDRSIAEPYAGGAGASLSLLFMEETQEMYINDADPAIHDFWWAILNRTNMFADMFSRTRASMAEWYRQREIYRQGGRVSHLRRGFSAFYLNRCNRSGIIMNGGPIGGMKQTGKWKINARYNKSELLRRIERIAEYRNRIHVSSSDGMDFIASRDIDSTFFFIDPPYFEKGQTLYLNLLDSDYHASLAEQLYKMRSAAWIVTYDDCPEIRSLYRGWAKIRAFSLRYSAAERRRGKEVLIAPKWLRLPCYQTSDAITG